MKKNILDWKMNYREYKDIPCTVPCSMYSVMLENEYMEDPFFGLNEIDATKMSDYDTEFISNFIIEEQELENQYINLNFLGLDTLGEICRCSYDKLYELGKKENLNDETMARQD